MSVFDTCSRAFAASRLVPVVFICGAAWEWLVESGVELER